MAKLSDTRFFNNTSVFVDGWYWLLPSKELKSGKVVGINFLGKSLAVYLGESGKVFAIEAYCPHMGAHFKEGKVEGDAIRCAFHGWKFDSTGQCSDIPCKVYSDQARMIPPLESYVVEEHYGLVWIYTGQNKGAEIEPLPRYLLFPHRSTMDGGTQGVMVYVARKKTGFLNLILAKIVARVTAIVAAYFERGDREIFEPIKFSMRAPVKADHLIIEFMRHTERQSYKALPWKGSSASVEEQGAWV